MKSKHSGTVRIRRWRLTPRGCLSRAYYFAKRRTQGKTYRSIHYAGLPIDSWEKWLTFLRSSEFIKAYEFWRDNRYLKSYRPTPDRKDTTKGYTLDNIQWKTYKDNVAQTQFKSRIDVESNEDYSDVPF